MTYASVFAQGTARLVEHEGERRRGLAVLMDHYERLWGTPEGVEPGKSPIPEAGILKRTEMFCMDVEGMSARRRP